MNTEMPPDQPRPGIRHPQATPLATVTVLRTTRDGVLVNEYRNAA